MLFRHLRLLVAGVAAVVAICASPARSNADVTILIEELNAGGTTILSQTTTIPTASVLPTNSNSPAFTGQYFTGVTASVSTNSSSPSLVASLTPIIGGQLTSAFDVTQNHKLRITVTDNNFTPLGPTGTLKVDVQGTNSGLGGGTISLVEETKVFDPANPSPLIAHIPTLTSPDGTKVSDTANVTGLPGPYAIQQTITISFGGTPSANGTFGSTGGANITTNAVPAPGGLALALIGLPLIGLRRVFRKRATPAV